MAGFVLGTGSGVLACVAVYYTISTSISSSTASLRSELHNSALLLNNSFQPTTPPAPAASIGPQYPSRPSFSDILRLRWNHAIGRAVRGVEETDWAAVGAGASEGGREVIEKLQAQGAGGIGSSLGGSAGDAAGNVKVKAAQVEGGLEHAQQRVEEGVQKALKGLKSVVENAKEDAREVKSSLGVVLSTEGDLTKETFTGGSAAEVKAKREGEKKLKGRLV